MILSRAKANRANFGAIACVFALLTILAVPSSQAFADDSFESRVDALKAQADAGDPGSEFVLGSLFRQTLPDHPPDFRIAVEWFEKAAKRGNAMAAEMAGMTYQAGGFGLERNLEKARLWYRKAANAGRPVAQLNLGYMEYHGEGGLTDLQDAQKWAKAAADQPDKVYRRMGLELLQKIGPVSSPALEQSSETTNLASPPSARKMRVSRLQCRAGCYTDDIESKRSCESTNGMNSIAGEMMFGGLMGALAAGTVSKDCSSNLQSCLASCSAN